MVLYNILQIYNSGPGPSRLNHPTGNHIPLLGNVEEGYAKQPPTPPHKKKKRKKADDCVGERETHFKHRKMDGTKAEEEMHKKDEERARSLGFQSSR